MNFKKMLIIIGAFLLIMGLTIGGLILFKGTKTSESSNESSRGIAPADDFIFDKISGVVALPTFSQLPTNADGWNQTTSNDSANYINNVMTNTDSCTLTATSQQSIYTDDSLNDYQFSKSFINSLVAGERGTLRDEYIIKLASNQGDVYFYSGIYNPQYELSSGGTDGTEINDYTTFIAARSITTAIATSSSTSTTDGVVSSYKIIPSISIKYRCKTDQFKVDDALTTIKQIRLDFTSNRSIDTSANTDGK